MFTCKALQSITSCYYITKIIYLATYAKMAERGYQHSNSDHSDHSEVTQNVYKIVFACMSFILDDRKNFQF